MFAIQILIATLSSSCIIRINAKEIQAHQEIQAQSQSLYDVSLFSSSSLPNYLPNIEYLGQGYNIFFGNPHSTTGLDSGFKNQLLIEYEYESDVKRYLSADKRWIVPKGVKFSSYQSCSSSYSSKEISTLQEYSESLQVGVSVGASYFGASFSASADYKQVEKTLNANDSMFVESHAQCVLFDVGLYLNRKKQQPQHKLKFKSVFLMKLKKLARQNSPQEYFNFFAEYGTHMTTQVKLGSKFGYRFQMRKAIQTAMQSLGVNVAAAASFYCASASFSTELEKQSSQAFEADLQNRQSFSFGARPDPNNDVAKWASQAITNSLPVSMKLVPYEEVIDFIPSSSENQTTNLDESEKSTLKFGFIRHSQQYCADHLKLKNCKRYFENVAIMEDSTKTELAYSFINDGQKQGDMLHFTQFTRDTAFDILPTKNDFYWIVYNKQCVISLKQQLGFGSCDDNSLFAIEYSQNIEGGVMFKSITKHATLCVSKETYDAVFVDNADVKDDYTGEMGCVMFIKEKK